MSETGSSGSKSLRNGAQRRLRERKQRKLYMEEWALGDDDGEGSRGFSVAEKLESAKFAQPGIVKEIRGADLNVGYLQRVGMNVPLLIREKSGLGIRMPDPNEFTVNDVRLCVGSRRLVDVMDVNTQKNIQMTMKEWQHYYESQQKERLLNVISLEFSHTRLDQYVQSPDIVRQIDWADIVWPKQLKDAQRDPTNCMGEMMYPKVQKYCLMSVRNCYTDFHIDFGGTSVWYHILKGSKVFWLIPPTDRNLQLYERWVLSGKQSDVFFGDTVEKCARVYLTAGNTFFIPSGWIHAVYTPEDSLVFGGNFLHSFGIIKQLKTVHVEDATRVPQKFRYPFFTEMLWYVLARYVHTLLGHSHLYGEQSASELEMSARPHVHLTHYELFGLKEIVMYLYDLPPQKKNVPELVRDPVLLIKDVRNLVERHCRDKMEMACTGMSVLLPQGENQPKWQPYVRARVKQEIKMEIARRNAEIICEQKALQAANQADNPDNSTINSTIASLSNCTMDGKVIEIKKDFTENSHTTSNENTETGLFTSPTEFLKYRPPKKMHLANAVAAAASVGNGSPVVSSTTANNGNSNSNASSSSISNNNNNTNNNNNKNNNNSIIKIELAASTAATSQTSVNNRSECYSPPSSTTSLMHNQDMLKFSPTTTGMGQPRRRRTRCKVCAACQRNDCGECSFCLDMVKFGGPGRAKQTCMMRQCLAPMLPITAQCAHCHLDGWRQMPVAPQTKQFTTQEGPSALMECSVCYEITHPDCALQKLTGSAGKGIVNEDLPNSWECPNCCYSGKNNDYKPRHFRARQKFSEVRRINTTGTESGGEGVPYYDFILTSESEMETNCASNNTVRQLSKRAHQKSGGGEVKSERSNSEYGEKSKRRKSDDDQSLGGSSRQDSIDANASADCSHSNSNTSHNGITTQLSASSASLNPVIATETVIKRKKSSIRSQLAQQMLNSSTRVLKKPQYVVRPAGNASNNSSHAYTAYSTSTNLAMEPYLLKLVFRHLPPEALVTCSAVCKGWANVAVDPDLWKNMNVAEHKMTANLLTAIVRRQPEQLVLDWTQIAKRQLVWLVSRLPALKQLSMQNCPIQAVQALHTCLCPPLQYLDLSFVSSLNDAAIRDILAPPKDSRPGLTDSKSRLRDLKTFKLAGTDISDVALRYITQTLITLIHLDLSSCQRITDAGVAQIGTSVKARATLIELNLSGCRLVTEQSLEYLSKCEQLMLLDLRHVPQVSTQAVIKFAAKSKHDLCVKDIKLVERRHIHTTTTTAAITTMGREGGSSNCLSATNRWHE